MISNYNRLPDVLYKKNRFTAYAHVQAVQSMGSTPRCVLAIVTFFDGGLSQIYNRNFNSKTTMQGYY